MKYCNNQGTNSLENHNHNKRKYKIYSKISNIKLKWFSQKDLFSHHMYKLFFIDCSISKNENQKSINQKIFQNSYDRKNKTETIKNNTNHVQFHFKKENNLFFNILNP